MTMPNPPSAPRGANGEIPHWFVLAGGAVAVVALFVFMKNRQSGVGNSTVAAGTSINAALGSLQEEVLNVQGDTSKIQAGQSVIHSQISDVASGVEGVQASTDLNRMVLVGALPTASHTYFDILDPSHPLYNTNAAAALATETQGAAHLTTAATGTF